MFASSALSVAENYDIDSEPAPSSRLFCRLSDKRNQKVNRTVSNYLWLIRISNHNKRGLVRWECETAISVISWLFQYWIALQNLYTGRSLNVLSGSLGKESRTKEDAEDTSGVDWDSLTQELWRGFDSRELCDFHLWHRSLSIMHASCQPHGRHSDWLDNPVIHYSCDFKHLYSLAQAGYVDASRKDYWESQQTA